MPSSSAPGPMIFVTASVTGVGKTLLTCLCLRSLRNRNQRPVGLKPFCSGSRADAQHLHRASGKPIDLEAINPWYNKTPIAPGAQKHPASFQQVLRHIDGIRPCFQQVVLEGAGGLLSPLGQAFHLGDLILHYQPKVLCVFPNQLGVLNQALIHHAWFEQKAPGISPQFVLMERAKPDASASSNLKILKRWLPSVAISSIPYLGPRATQHHLKAVQQPPLARMLKSLFPHE